VSDTQEEKQQSKSSMITGQEFCLPVKCLENTWEVNREDTNNIMSRGETIHTIPQEWFRQVEQF